MTRWVAGKWYPCMTPQERSELLEQLRYNGRRAERHAWYCIGIAHQTSRPFQEEAKAIVAPVLYMYGEQSDFKKCLVEPNVECLGEHLLHFGSAAIADGIHDVEFEKPDEVAAHTLAFLAEKSALGGCPSP